MASLIESLIPRDAHDPSVDADRCQEIAGRFREINPNPTTWIAAVTLYGRGGFASGGLWRSFASDCAENDLR